MPYSMPAVTQRRDLEQFSQIMYRAQLGTPLSYELLVAQTLQESSWLLHAYRYEPNFDRRYISSMKARTKWSTDPAWIKVGPTCRDWFVANPRRASERSASADYSFLAQTRISSSYGPFQLMYPVATELGYVGLPEDLRDPETNVALGVKLLMIHYRAARAKWPHKSSLMIALARYNGGAASNNDPAHLRNIDYVRHINRRYQQCWGTPLFAGL